MTAVDGREVVAVEAAPPPAVVEVSQRGDGGALSLDGPTAVLEIADRSAPLELGGSYEVVAVEVGPAPGPQGGKGDKGDKGDPGGDVHHIHHQGMPSRRWVVVHNLGKHPLTMIEDGGGTAMMGTITYLDDDTLLIDFAYPLTGRANCT